ncbi:MAG: hypothetical protein E3K32_07760 [wastewater metagenome]|nr:hypothetical protein [Candidatus Loosdrechtia aerotolerans]
MGFMSMGFAQQDIRVKEGVRKIGKQEWASDVILVKFKEGVSQDTIHHINQSNRCSMLSKKNKREQFTRLKIPNNRTAKEMVKVYRQNPKVEYAELNFIAHALWYPNDPDYSYQWHLHNPQYKGINIESAWGIQTGNSGVIVAVIDTGIAYENYGEQYKQAPDLANTSFVAGYDFVNDDTHPNDDDGHGTHVTGTIAQSTDNNLGVAGVAFHVSIMPIKVLNDNGSGTYADVADGIYFAADNNANVINMSLGGSSQSITLKNALAYAYSKGITIVCAAGNEYQDGNLPSFPAAYDAYCIAVGATRYDETRSYYSSTGSYLDITAPGGDLNIDQNGDGYADGILQQTFGNSLSKFSYYFYQGTSMASPHVAGAAALLISKGITSPDDVRSALESTAEDKGPAGWDEEYGWGIVDAAAALNYSVTPVHDVAVTSLSAEAILYQGDMVPVVVDVANQGDYEETFTLTLSDTSGSGEIGSQSITLPDGGTTTVTFNWDTTGASIGDHVLIAEASTVTGETDTTDNSLTTTVEVQEQPTGTAMHVSDITIDLKRRGSRYKALAKVTIVDQDNSNVAGAMVTGDWVLSSNDVDTYITTSSDTTNSSGVARLNTGWVKANTGDILYLTVKNVIKDGYSYDSTSNSESSDSVVVHRSSGKRQQN